MRTESRRIGWSWVGLGLSVLMSSGLAAGCGGTEGSDANDSQKFEKPAGPVPEPKVVPDKQGGRDANELSPRERRALNKAKS